jgi:hypothetical protein
MAATCRSFWDLIDFFLHIILGCVHDDALVVMGLFLHETVGLEAGCDGVICVKLVVSRLKSASELTFSPPPLPQPCGTRTYTPNTLEQYLND